MQSREREGGREVCLQCAGSVHGSMCHFWYNRPYGLWASLAVDQGLECSLQSLSEKRFRARGRLQVREGRGQKGGVEDRISGSLNSSSWCLQQTEDEWPSAPQTSEGREWI